MTGTVMVIGGGRVGGALVRLLADDGNEVLLLEKDPGRATRIAADTPGAQVVTGDGTDPAVLESAGIRRMDVVAAITGDDACNLVVTALARFEFGIARTIARIVDPTHAWLYNERAGVDIALDQVDLMARLIVDEVSLSDVATLVKLRRGDFALVEEHVAPGAPAEGQTVGSLDLPSNCALVAVLRGDEVLACHREFRLQVGDEVLAVVHAGSSEHLERALREPPR